MSFFSSGNINTLLDMSIRAWQQRYSHQWFHRASKNYKMPSAYTYAELSKVKEKRTLPALYPSMISCTLAQVHKSKLATPKGNTAALGLG